MNARQLSRREFLSLCSATAAAACGGVDGIDDPVAETVGAGGAGTSSSSVGSGRAGEGGGGGAGTNPSGAGGDGGQGGTDPGDPTGPEPVDPWDAPGQQDDVAFAWGVQSGDATTTAVLLSVRSTEPELSLTVMRGTSMGWEEAASGQWFTSQDGMVHLELTSLLPDTVYAVAFYSKDGQRRSRVARFRTAIPDGSSRVVRFGATSCFGDVNDPWPSVSHSIKHKLDFFLLLGDAIYADNDPDKFDYVAKYKHALSLSGLQDLTAGTSIVATWDDHEIDNNWSWSTPGIQMQFDEALAAFRQHLPQRVAGAPTQLWRRLSWGDALDIFVLDCRGERKDGLYLSVAQMDWLKQELVASTAAFKVIMTSVPIFDFTGTVIGSAAAADRWQGYPTQRNELLDHVRDQSVKGVLWISGDVHFGAVAQVDQDGGPGDDQWEIIAGPTGSFINPVAFLLKGKRMPVVQSKHNWVMVEADPATGEAIVRFIGDAGNELATHTLKLH
ncbi:MAG: alkaline phosphatase D family protein [Polyangiaceae bacterium]